MQDFKISIVIASFSSIHHLDRCLTSLQADANNAEIIVSTSFCPEEVHLLQQRFNVKFVFNPEENNPDSAQLRETRVFRLRSSGILAAQGDIIILLEDHCEVTSEWLQSMQASLSDHHCIVGGPVENGSEPSLFHWALYWSEYAAMMPPFPNDNLHYLSAVNCAYFKTALDACKNTWQDGFHDNEVHDALIRQGTKLCLAPKAIVHTSLPFSFKQAFVHLFTGGQRYGRYRGGRTWNPQRILRIFATLLVPSVLLVRIFKLIRFRQPQQLLTFFLSFPVLYVLLTAWGGGELVGTLHGERPSK